MDELSAEEIKELLAIVARLGWKLHKLNNFYPTAKEFLEKSSNQATQKKPLATLFILFQISQGKIGTHKLYTPKELNKKIAENLISEPKVDENDMSVFDRSSEHQKFISSKEFRELLRLFERLGFLDRISGKKAIKGLGSPFNHIPDLMGRPEFYKLSINVVHLQYLLSKQGVIGLIVQSLEKSSFISEFLKKAFMASILMFRELDENNIHAILKCVNAETVLDLETFVKEIRPKREILLSVDNQTIQRVVTPIVNQMVSDILDNEANFITQYIILLALSEL